MWDSKILGKDSAIAYLPEIVEVQELGEARVGLSSQAKSNESESTDKGLAS